MMISPETYYIDELLGKTPDQIHRKIRSLRREISSLKREMERPGYAPLYCPAEDVQISCKRLYLERAKKALADMAIPVIPTATEQRDVAFNEALLRAEEIRLEITDYCVGTHLYAVRFSDPVVYSRKDYTASPPQEAPKSADTPTSLAEFIEVLSDIHIGEWRKHYSPERYGFVVMDGTAWHLTVTYKDGRKPYKCSGNNAYPYNFDKLCELMRAETPPRG